MADLDLFKMIANLSSAQGVKGNENAVGLVVADYLASVSDEVWRDTLGNVTDQH